jgi:hypothetical protein
VPRVPVSSWRPLKIILLASMVILSSIFFILGGVRYFEYDELAREGVQTQGQIVDLRCFEHSAFTYEFHVKDRVLVGHGIGGYGNRECTKLKMGDPILVYYLPKNGSVYTDENPAQLRDDEILSMMIAGVVFPLFLFAVWKFVRF